jgi:integrase
VSTYVPSEVFPGATTLLSRLFAAVRPEFRSGVYVPDPEDPVLGGGGRCAVEGCTRVRSTRSLCRSHHSSWINRGRPAFEVFLATATPIAGDGRRKDEFFDLRPLAPQLQLEVAYSLQCRHDERGSRLRPAVVNQVVDLLVSTTAESLLDYDFDGWVSALGSAGRAQISSAQGFLRYAWVKVDDLDTDADADAEYARDIWNARRLCLPMGAGQGHYTVRFDGIPQLWLRASVKRWARYELSRGHAFATVRNQVNALRWFARFLEHHHRGAVDASVINRDLLESYLSWMATGTLVAHTRLRYLIYLRAFFDHCRRYDWLPELAASATLYADDLPRTERPLPRFISDFVMAQLESEANLARLPDLSTRHLVVLLMETGLRCSDACALVFNPTIDDSVGWPCLRFFNAKVRTEELIPLSPLAARTIRAQQDHVHQRWPEGVPWLFPRPHANPDGLRPFVYGTLERRLARWAEQIGAVDEAGCPVTITAHRFRHTLGTRLINQGVPQHIVQRLLCHASPQMTGVYAHLHDTTVRQAFEEYSRRRVDISGEVLGFDPLAPTADAEWVKHNLARIQASLPNGYCGRPPQQDCPHPNACLTCVDFQTTPEFLPVHRQQAESNRILIATAEANGQFRLVANHRRVQQNLERIIVALGALEDGGNDDAR